MISYEDLVNYLVEVAERHPNIRYVKFDADVSAINRPDFVCPAFIISPTTTSMNDISVVDYGFQLLYLDKLNQEEDNYTSILEDGLHFILQYLEVIELDYKVLKGLNIDPVMDGYEGGIMIGQQAQIQIESQYNITRNKSYFYGSGS